jgi:hypothetical protein
MTPMMSATCCRHGVAPTSCPVLRSCRLSFEIVATLMTIAVTNSANATSAAVEVRIAGPCVSASSSSEAPRTVRIARPDTGEFDEPIRPAM